MSAISLESERFSAYQRLVPCQDGSHLPPLPLSTRCLPRETWAQDSADSAEAHFPPNCGSLPFFVIGFLLFWNPKQKTRMRPRPSTAPTLAETTSDTCWRRLPVCRGDYGIGARLHRRQTGPAPPWPARCSAVASLEASRATPPSNIDTPNSTSSHPPNRWAIRCQTTPTPESSA